MLTISQIEANAEDQDRGRWCDLVDPFTGELIGIRLLIAGPDSATQAAAQLKLADELAAELDEAGRVSAAAREAARLRCLARCILDWQAEEDGKPVPFSFANVLRLLKASKWVQAQADAFAADRRRFAPDRGEE